MMGAATIGAVALMAGPAAADSLSCLLDDGTPVNFVLDRNQFIDAVTPEEPIRRKMTSVRMGDTRFPAEPFIIGEVRGFHAESLGGTSVMFVVQPSGMATYANVTTGVRRPGRCEVRQ